MAREAFRDLRPKRFLEHMATTRIGHFAVGSNIYIKLGFAGINNKKSNDFLSDERIIIILKQPQWKKARKQLPKVLREIAKRIKTSQIPRILGRYYP